MKLKTTTDLVLEQLYPKNIEKKEFELRKIHNYAKFLKNKLKIEMFFGDNKYFEFTYINDKRAFLFHPKLNEYQSIFLYLNETDSFVLNNYWNDKIIEDLSRFDLSITEYAIKKHNL